MPVTFAPGWQAPPSTIGSALLGLSKAFDTFAAYKNEQRDYKLKLDEVARRNAESEQMRKVRNLEIQRYQKDLEDKAKIEQEQEAAQRSALAVPGGETKIGELPIATKSGGALASLVAGASKPAPIDLGPQFTPAAPPVVAPVQPGPLAPMIAAAAPAPAPTPPPTVTPGALSLMGTVPTGPLSAEQRVQAKKKLETQAATEAQQRQISTQRELDKLRETVESPWDWEFGGHQIKAGERIPTVIYNMESQRRAQESAQAIADKRIAAAETRAQGAQAATEGRAEAKKTKEKTDLENTYRKEYFNEAKKLLENKQQIDRYTASIEDTMKGGGRPSAAAQYGLIYAFNKALDPTSVVRESEFSNTRSVAAGYVDQALQYFNRVAKGEMLTDRQVKEMMDVIRSSGNRNQTALDTVTNKYRDIALQKGIDPGIIFGRPAEEAHRQKAVDPNDPEGILSEPEKAAGNKLGLVKPGKK